MAASWDCFLGCWLWGEGHTRCVCEDEPLQPVGQGDDDHHVVGDGVLELNIKLVMRKNILVTSNFDQLFKKLSLAC